MRHTGTKEIETERLILRPFAEADLQDMLQNWISDPEIQHEYGEPCYPDAESAGALLQKWIASYADPAFYRWAVIERESGKNIGQIAFCRVYSDCKTAEIEYCIGKAFWGKGYAGEALSAVIAHTFAHTEFEKLEAYHRAENRKSGRVLEKSEMHVTENVERFRRGGETPEGEVCYCIRRDGMDYSGITEDFIRSCANFGIKYVPDAPLCFRVIIKLLYENDWARARQLLEANPQAFADEHRWMILDSAVGMCLNEVTDRQGNRCRDEAEMKHGRTYFPTEDCIAFIAYLLENGADPHLPERFPQLQNLDDVESDAEQQTGFHFDCSAVRALLKQYWN
ncbi:MAG: GNAT family N-acetyltransferase [Oscillospiraceae bacterium]|nr:GNAT family N-acetyltransferase [Oscillospiraceae bacterium]